jgi:uncharacterized protein (DUF58 family)
MPTTKALIVAILSFTLLLIAANLQTGWIYFLSFFLLAEIVSGFVASRFQLKKTTIKRRLPLRAIADKPFKIVYEIKEAPLGFAILEKDLKLQFRFNGFQEKFFVQEVQLKRGCYNFNELVVETDLPAGLFKTSKKFLQPAKLIVWPESDLESIQFGGDFYAAVGLLEGAHKRYGEEYAGVREYRPGDPLKKIHWKKTASYREILVREEVDTYQKRTAVFLNNVGIKDSETFEDLLAVARTVAENLLSRGVVYDFYFFEAGELKRLSNDIFQINDALACLKPEEKEIPAASFEENIYPTLVVITADNFLNMRLQFFGRIVFFLLGSDPSSFRLGSRIVRIVKVGGQRKWIF